jgi:hypothetical protein
VHQIDGDRSFTHGGSHALYISCPYIADGKYTRQAEDDRDY